jgi:hypothetical protein
MRTRDRLAKVMQFVLDAIRAHSAKLIDEKADDTA